MKHQEVNKVGMTVFQLAILVIMTVSCSSESKKEAVTEANAPAQSWSGQMSELNKTLDKLGQYIYNEKSFNEPDNFDVIKSQTKKLSELAHTLDTKQMKAPTSDPAVTHFASQFKDDLNRAYESLNSDHRAYARTVLKTSVSYCISCHTRSGSGPAYPLLTDASFAMSLQPIERARFYTATRQYDAALKQFLDILEDPETGKKRPFDIERSARSAMALAIRVKQDPDSALKVVNDVLKKSDTPLFVRTDAEVWKKSIEEWKKDKSNPTTEAGYLAKIKSLVSQADKVQRYPSDMKADVYHLRATAMAHDYFNKFPDPKSKVEVMYLAGRSYEALRELGFWTLHEMYYEQCVRQAAHTPMARKCYEELEQSVLLGYSGSAGVFLPASVRKQLEDLRGLTTLK